VSEEVIVPFADYPDIVTPEDLIKMLRIGRNAAYKLIHSGEIASFRVGKHYKITKQSVIAYVSQYKA